MRSRHRRFSCFFSPSDASQNWRDLPFIGVELKSIADIYAEPYDFPDFAREMSPGGSLWNIGHPIYVFLGAQRAYPRPNSCAERARYTCVTP